MTRVHRGGRTTTRPPLPTFFLVGAHKAATTAVSRYLDQHPDVFMSPRKEPRYFALADESREFTGPDDPAGRFDLDREEDYRRLFLGVDGESAIGEASTLYLYHRRAAKNIARRIPGARIIAILRHPVERAYSNFLHCRRDGQEPEEDFIAALEEEERRVRAGWGPLWHYQRKGRYVSQLARYFQRFPGEQILVLTYDDLRRDPVGFMQTIYAFLDVDPGFVPDTSARWNPGGIPYSVTLQRAMKLPNPVKSAIAGLLPTSLKRRTKRLIQRANLRPAPTLPTDVRDALTRHLYGNEIFALEEHTGLPVAKAWLPEPGAGRSSLSRVQAVPRLGPEAPRRRRPGSARDTTPDAVPTS